jgi:hypothetical protein
VKLEDKPGLEEVVNKGDDGTFKVSEDDVEIGDEDANTTSGTLCQRIHHPPSDNSVSSTDTAEPVELHLLHPSISSSVQPHFPKTEKTIRTESGHKLNF